MKIAIDISQVVYSTGVSVYTKNLVENLLKLEKQSLPLRGKENEYLLFGGTLRRTNELKKFASKIFPIPPTLADLIWNKLHVFPIEYLVGKIDVFHSSDWTQPPSRAFKVTTVHDLSPLVLPEWTDKNVAEVHKRRLVWVKKEVDRVIAVSEATKKDLIEHGFNEEKIRVIYEAPDPIFRPASKVAVERLKKTYKIAGSYILVVGTSPRKNTDRILKAYRAVKMPGLTLVIVGDSTRSDYEADGALRVGRIDDEELATFYSGAEALIYPSLYEGFGLSIVQAFASGCPVVTSNISSMPEVAGDAAVLVDPYSVESIAEGIKDALENREGLIQKGLKRVKEFSWEKTARETLEVYKEALFSNL